MCSSDRRQPGSNAAVAASPLAGTLSALAMPPSGASYCSCAHSIHSRCVLRSARSSSMDWQTSWRHTFHNTGRNTGVSGGACQGGDGCTCDSCATTTVKGVWQQRPFSPTHTLAGPRDSHVLFCSWGMPGGRACRRDGCLLHQVCYTWSRAWSACNLLRFVIQGKAAPHVLDSIGLPSVLLGGE